MLMLKLGFDMKSRALEITWLALLLVLCPADDLDERCPAKLGAGQACAEASPEPPSSALLQRGSHLKILADVASTEQGAEHWQFDHEGIKWQGRWEPFNRSAQAGGIPLAAFISRASHSSKAQKSGSESNRPITFVTVHDHFFATNLGKSPLWLNRANTPHEWILLDNREARYNISDLYARSQAVAQNDLLVYIHPDVILPEEWYDGFMQKLDAIEAKDPNWGVLGTAGVSLDWTPHQARRELPPGERVPRVASCISDCITTYKTGVDSLPVQSLDESLLVLRRNASLSFDRKLPGFDLYGMDIVMDARKAGMVSYLLNIPIKHKTVDIDGQKFNATIFSKKVSEASYQKRLRASMAYFYKKWCGSGLLPIWGTSFEVHQRNGTCPQ